MQAHLINGKYENDVKYQLSILHNRFDYVGESRINSSVVSVKLRLLCNFYCVFI